MTMSKKACSRCGKRKKLSRYYKHPDYLDGRFPYCKRCAKRVSHISKVARADVGQRALRKVCAYLTDHPCVDCDESNIVVLDFDHVIGKKESSISRMPGSLLPWRRIKQEVKKCEVRCRNCHERRTAKELGFYKVADSGTWTKQQRRLMRYLIRHSCVDCGESDPIVLEFDHVRGQKKEALQT